MTYTVSQAKNMLPELIRLAQAGTRVTITRRGVPIAEIIRKVDELPRTRIFGVLGNKTVVIDPDWARPQEDLNSWLSGDV